MSTYLLAIDQGTTSTRAIVYDEHGRCLGTAQREFTQHYPQPGWVEHDPEEIWQTVAHVVPRALDAAKIDAKQLTAIGITNQRETSIIWDRSSGKPVARALVWQDRRTADFCKAHQQDEPWLFERTGLVLDPYFSATKIRWLLENDAPLRRRATDGKLAWGTVDSFLIWRLTGGRAHATDVTNASRSLLLNLRTVAWDDDLCRFFAVPKNLLPEVRPSAADYGATIDLGFLPAGVPILGVAGDQQAALFGQGAYGPGEAKCTYGTGAFFLQHTGNAPVLSRHRLVSTLAATVDATPQYALEGSVFVAGAAIQWLRDGLKLFSNSQESESLAAKSSPSEPVLMIPGFVGLGAPHWQPDVRGAILGLTRGTTSADLARAALEGVAFQVADLIDAARQDSGQALRELRVDGGMAQNHWFLQRQADFLGIPVTSAVHSEATALGAALLAGWKAGIWSDLSQLRGLLKHEKRFEPAMRSAEREQKLATWRRAVRMLIDFHRSSTI
jgi:glycerol kinase